MQPCKNFNIVIVTVGDSFCATSVVLALSSRTVAKLSFLYYILDCDIRVTCLRLCTCEVSIKGFLDRTPSLLSPVFYVLISCEWRTPRNLTILCFLT